MSPSEIDADKLAASFNFCVYTHARPDGRVFYVGKGVPERAYCMAPSRRSLWHQNIVKKYGRENILVRVIPCLCEEEAFALERVQIAIHRLDGCELVNLTDGGEGASGHVMNEAQRQALEKGRRKGKRGVPGPRPNLDAWRNSPEGREHSRKMGEQGRIRLHAERSLSCAQCGVVFVTRSAKAKCCSRLCEQRRRRARQSV